MSVSTLPTGRPEGVLTYSTMSPAQAAQHAQVSRRTVMRAVEAGELQAIRDNRNRWQISRSELDRWAVAQWAHGGQRPPPAHPEAHPEIALQLAAAKATIIQMETRLQAAEQDRDRWRNMAEKLAERASSAPLRRRWWPF